LRRSSSIELCQWLLDQGAIVNAHDPVIHSLPENLSSIHLCATPQGTLQGATVLVIATEWPEYRQIDPICLKLSKEDFLIIDPNAFLSHQLSDIPKVLYLSVGKLWGKK
jgi:UDPglucose 6-dehydrogenase